MDRTVECLFFFHWVWFYLCLFLGSLCTVQRSSGGFSIACERVGRMSDHLFPACAFLFCFVFCFVQVEISSRALIRLFMQGSVHSGPTSWDRTVAECSLTSCVCARFRIGSHNMPGQRQNQLIPTSFVGSRVYACLGVTSHLHCWQNDRGLLRATKVSQGTWNGYRIRFSTQS